MSSKAYFAPFALLLKLCDQHGGHDWDDDDDEYVEEGPLDGGAGLLDCAVEDAAVDAGGEDAGVVDCSLLRGLYEPGSCDEIAPENRSYAPRFALWSDGAEKDRFVFLPEGAKIDTTDMDFWKYPVGTKLYKTFRFGSLKLETRVIERTADAWTFEAFAWREDQRGVVPAAIDGEEDVLGTDHDIPSQGDCLRCHTRAGQDAINGFSAIQLNHDFTDVGLAQLIDEGIVKTAHADALLERATVPGTPLDQAALGYLHTNCGICHGGEMPRAQFGLRLRVRDEEVHDTDAYKQGVNIPLRVWTGDRQVEDDSLSRKFVYRIVPGHPDKSAIVARMNSLVEKNRMPPLATEVVDEDGRATISAWISSLRPRPFKPWHEHGD